MKKPFLTSTASRLYISCKRIGIYYIHTYVHTYALHTVHTYVLHTVHTYVLLTGPFTNMQTMTEGLPSGHVCSRGVMWSTSVLLVAVKVEDALHKMLEKHPRVLRQ